MSNKKAKYPTSVVDLAKKMISCENVVTSGLYKRFHFRKAKLFQ